MQNLGACVLLLLAAGTAGAQVHYYKDGRPWKQRADRGPDAVVDGWYYNLGITGIRVELVEEAPKYLVVRHVFDGSPADGKVVVGDWLIGVAGVRFQTEHTNGYGMDKFGPYGPILEFANALERSQRKGSKGLLEIELLRDEKPRSVQLDVGTKYGAFSKDFPRRCDKCELIIEELCDYLVEHQRDDGSWGSPPQDTFAPLALMSNDVGQYRDAIEKNVRFHAKTTKAKDSSWLINWRYMAAAIVLSEYYLATGEDWVVPELDEIYRFLKSTQYTDMSQIDPKSKRERPQDMPKNATRAHGGWGHNPGFEGYGPIAMLTGQGALAFALMQRCGIDVSKKRHEYAYDFLARGTGKNGYLWYADEVAGHDNWADMGRTGASGIAHALSPYPPSRYRKRAELHAKVIGDNPDSFPDTHGSPIMGMGYAAMAAWVEPKTSFRKLMDANKWWFVLAQCGDGTFYYQPNRDNAGYGADSRVAASAVTAFILSIPKGMLHVTGKPFR